MLETELEQIGRFLEALGALSEECGIILVGSATGSLYAFGMSSGLELQRGICWLEGEGYTAYGTLDVVPTERA